MCWQAKTLNQMLRRRNVYAEIQALILENVQTDEQKHQLINWLLEMREVTQEQILAKAKELNKK